MPSILIVDDSPEIRAMLKTLLEAQGYTIHLAANGVAGKTAYEEVKPDLLLSDTRMPLCPGPEMIRHLSDTHKDMRVIVMTSEGTVSMLSTAIVSRLAAYTVIRKPFDIDQLLSTVEQFLPQDLATP